MKVSNYSRRGVEIQRFGYNKMSDGVLEKKILKFVIKAEFVELQMINIDTS